MKPNDIQHEGSLTKAALISSLLAPLPFVISILVNFLLQGDFQLFNLTEILGFLFLIMLFALPFTCIINFLLVVPVARLLRKKGVLSAIYIYIWCSLIAFPALASYITLLNNGSIKKFDFFTILIATLCGFCSGVVFCRVAKIRIKIHPMT